MQPPLQLQFLTPSASGGFYDRPNVVGTRETSPLLSSFYLRSLRKEEETPTAPVAQRRASFDDYDDYDLYDQYIRPDFKIYDAVPEDHIH